MDQACFRTLCESQQTAWFREKKRWRNIKLTDPPETVSLSCPLGFWLRKSSMVSPDYRSIGLIRRIERVQRKASKFILNLLYLCDESYRDRLISLELMPLSYWHEYIDLVFFFQAVNGLIDVSKYVLPQLVIPTRSSSTTELLFRPQKCRITTFQKSYFIRATRVWN
jgi:hypothetical protein